MNKIKLALEIPTCLLGELSEFTDYDFALSHKVLEDAAYARHFAARPKGRELILDNGTHEFGHSLSVEKILTAAQLVRPDFIVAPDHPDESKWSTDQAWETLSGIHRLGLPGKLAVALCGKDALERERMLKELPSETGMLCFAYDYHRLEWFLEQQPHFHRIHLFGVSELLELRAWVDLANLPSMSHISFSVDTAKPVKWGFLDRDISQDNRPLRFSPISSTDLLNLERPSPERVSLITQNILFLQGILRIPSPFLSRGTNG